MNIMLLAGVQQLPPAPSTSLVLQMLLALGSFLAGLNLASLELCFLGLAFGSRRSGGRSRGSNNLCSSSFSPEPS
jgi:hypothetical protein